MGSKTDQIKKFFNNIKTTHHKLRGCDFTIRDKYGVKIKSHRLFLATQSEYFSALFRRHPMATETTFKDFTNDVIKISLDYIYFHKVDLTRNNVQDVLMFADFINLTEVIELCAEYIIRNIDQSNCGHVINLGNALGIDKLVQAGVSLALKSLAHNIVGLNEFTKGMINTNVVGLQDLQQKRVTIMTTEQWNINRLRKFLAAPEELMDFQPRASSVYTRKESLWGPRFAINGIISADSMYFFHSELERHPWLEVKLPSPVLISSVTIVNRQNCYRERLRNVEVRAGMEPVHEGFTSYVRGHNADKKLEVNSRWGHFPGLGFRFIPEGHVIKFERPILAQYITLQILEVGYLQINGIKINGGDLLNYQGHF